MKDATSKFPCVDCLCLSVCRNRGIDSIFRHCSLLLAWFNPKETDPDKIADKIAEFSQFIRPELYEHIPIDRRGKE